MSLLLKTSEWFNWISPVTPQRDNEQSYPTDMPHLVVELKKTWHETVSLGWTVNLLTILDALRLPLAGINCNWNKGGPLGDQSPDFTETVRKIVWLGNSSVHSSCWSACRVLSRSFSRCAFCKDMWCRFACPVCLSLSIEAVVRHFSRRWSPGTSHFSLCNYGLILFSPVPSSSPIVSIDAHCLQDKE